MVRQYIRRPHLVIVGNGMAAGRLIDELLKRDASQFEITIVGEEAHGSYNRIMLSPVLAGELAAESVIQKDANWYKDHGIRFIAGGFVQQIYADSKHIRLASGHNLFFDELVLATGSRPAKIKAHNQHLQNIYSFRTLRDVDTISKSAELGRHAVVVGGGLLGLEAAHGLAQKGIGVTVVHRSNRLLNRQLDDKAAKMLQALMALRHIQFELNAEITEFSGTDRVAMATLNNGKRLPCDLAVIATGITPNAMLGESAGAQVNRGIDVDAYMRTNQRHISALGECCEFQGETFGLVEPIWEQCVVLAERLACDNLQAFELKPVPTKLKVSGIHLFSSGDYITREDHRELVVHDPASGVYRKLLIKDNRLVGSVLFGDVRDGQFYFELMQKNIPIDSSVPDIIFGKAWCEKHNLLNFPETTSTETAVNAA